MNPGVFAPEKYKILIVTDAWAPQVNGVVRTLEILGADLAKRGHTVRYVTPEHRVTIPMPTYPEIRLSLFARRAVAQEIKNFAPDVIHIATEGPLGLAARRICIKHGHPFSTSFHTRFPEYVHARFPFIPEALVYRWLKWFHGPASAMMVATHTLKREMMAHGFTNLRIWSRGVDVDKFHPVADASWPYPKPCWLYVGRVAIEKNIESFLALDLPGTKIVVGEGPQRAELTARYPDVRFLGPQAGDALVRAYSASDVFVFPSQTDTFGLVLLEALACGTPVAAYPVQGPLDVIGRAPVGALDMDLKAASMRALSLSRQAAREFALGRSWDACTRQFLANMVPDPPEDPVEDATQASARADFI